MDDFMKMLLEKAVKEGKLHAIHMDEAPNCKCTVKYVTKNGFAEAEKEAAEIAKLNKILYEAHIKAGFTKNEALALTRTVISTKNN